MAGPRLGPSWIGAIVLIDHDVERNEAARAGFVKAGVLALGGLSHLDSSKPAEAGTPTSAEFF